MATPARTELRALYGATRYLVHAPGGTVDARIGEMSPALDAVLSAEDARAGCFITAANPRSEQRSAARQRRVSAVTTMLLDAASLYFRAFYGVPTSVASLVSNAAFAAEAAHGAAPDVHGWSFHWTAGALMLVLLFTAFYSMTRHEVPLPLAMSLVSCSFLIIQWDYSPMILRSGPVTSSAPSLHWEAYGGAVAYRVVRDRTFLGTVSTPSFTDAGLTADGVHTYRVRAVRADGTWSVLATVQVTYDGDVCATAVANLTMFQHAFGVGNVDSVYWTLQVELCFYAIVLALLYFRRVRYTAFVLAGWTVRRFSWEHVMFDPGYVRSVLTGMVGGPPGPALERLRLAEPA